MKIRLLRFTISLLVITVAFGSTCYAQYQIPGSPLSKSKLESYLSRSIMMHDFADNELSPAKHRDDMDLLEEVNPLFVGQIGGQYQSPWGLASHITRMSDAIQECRNSSSPNIRNAVFQAGIFEVVFPDLNQAQAESTTIGIKIPSYVQLAFSPNTSPDPERIFDFLSMLYTNPAVDTDEANKRGNWVFDNTSGPFPQGRYRWNPQQNTSQGNPIPTSAAPDISQVETKMWFYYLATKYIDAGCESLHFGQVHLLDKDDPNHQHWWSLLKEIRKYAANKNRGFVICSADAAAASFCNFYVNGLPSIPDNTQLLFDTYLTKFRLQEIEDANSFTSSPPAYPGRIALNTEKRNTSPGTEDETPLLGKVTGGRTPFGWRCKALPYLLSFDNDKPDPATVGGWNGSTYGHATPWQLVFGWDEISWFANCSALTRSATMKYLWSKSHCLDPYAHVMMPGRYTAYTATITGGAPATLTPGMYFPEQSDRATINYLWSGGEKTWQLSSVKGSWGAQAGMVFGETGGGKIYYIASDNSINICERNNNDEIPFHHCLGNPGPDKGDFTAYYWHPMGNNIANDAAGDLVWDDTYQHLFYRDINNQVCLAAWDPASNSWQKSVVRDSWGAQPGFVLGATGGGKVYYTTSTHDIYVCEPEAGSSLRYYAHKLNNYLLSNAAGDLVYDDASQHLFYRGTDSKVWLCEWESGCNSSGVTQAEGIPNFARGATVVSSNKSFSKSQAVNSLFLSAVVYPNPTNEKQVTLEIRTGEEQTIWVQVVNSLGSLIEERSVLIAPGKKSLQLKLPAEGMYLIKVKAARASLSNKVVFQH